MIRLTGKMDRGAGLRGVIGVGDLEEAEKQKRPLIDLPQSLARIGATRLERRQRLGQAIPLMFEANELRCGFGARPHHTPCWLWSWPGAAARSGPHDQPPGPEASSSAAPVGQ